MERCWTVLRSQNKKNNETLRKNFNLVNKKIKETLDVSRVSTYNGGVNCKDDDKDSRICFKGKANRGW